MILVLAGVVVGINVLQDQMDNTGSGSGFIFSATDRKGKPCTESIFKENKITMVNLWEPWCGPCVSEMPELQRLYNDYKDKGFMVIGVYSSTDMEFQVSQVLRDANVTYPIIPYNNSFSRFQSGAVPTSVFFDSKGRVIDMKKSTSKSGVPVVVGSRSYADWEAMIKPYL